MDQAAITATSSLRERGPENARLNGKNIINGNESDGIVKLDGFTFGSIRIIYEDITTYYMLIATKQSRISGGKSGPSSAQLLCKDSLSSVGETDLCSRTLGFRSFFLLFAYYYFNCDD